MGLTTYEQIEKYIESRNSGDQEQSFATPQKIKSEMTPTSKIPETATPTVAASLPVIAESNQANPESSVPNSEVKEEAHQDGVTEEKPKGAIEEIKKAPGYDELVESEKALCEEMALLPRIYQAFKIKIQQKSAKSHNSIRRVTALEFVDKTINKDRALYIFDFMNAIIIASIRK